MTVAHLVSDGALTSTVTSAPLSPRFPVTTVSSGLESHSAIGRPSAPSPSGQIYLEGENDPGASGEPSEETLSLRSDHPSFSFSSAASSPGLDPASSPVDGPKSEMPIAQAPTASTTQEHPRPLSSATRLVKPAPSRSPPTGGLPKRFPSSPGCQSPHLPKRRRSCSAKLLPSRYENADPKILSDLVGSMLSELVNTNDQIPVLDVELTRFHSREKPVMSVNDYLHRIVVHATLHPAVLLSIIYYIDQLCVACPTFTISSLTVHRVLIAAATVAAKGLSDSFWTNDTYAKVGGIQNKELNMLEMDLLTRLDWRIIPPEENLEAYYRGLVDRTDEYEIEDGDDDDQDELGDGGLEDSDDSEDDSDGESDGKEVRSGERADAKPGADNSAAARSVLSGWSEQKDDLSRQASSANPFVMPDSPGPGLGI